MNKMEETEKVIEIEEVEEIEIDKEASKGDEE